jgi:hypothetical protein
MNIRKPDNNEVSKEDDCDCDIYYGDSIVVLRIRPIYV